ncbi:MAG TPA: hypothetical protein VG826_05290 [Pirellulales bacterium]|nr:hypothetical protein [Pirellulales bacterium]
MLKQPLVLSAGQQQQLQAADYLNTGIPYWMHKNRILNGDFNIWQRGTALNTITTTGAYFPDQWQFAFDGTSPSINVQQKAFTVGQTSVPDNPASYCECSVSLAASGQTFLEMLQRIEGSQTFQGQYVTISFWAKADAARTLQFQIDRNYGTGGSPSSTETAIGGVQSFSLSTSWQQFTATIQLTGTSGKTLGTNGNDYLQLAFKFPVNSGFTIDIAHVQFEQGQNATAFEYRNVQHELIMCQRYFESFIATGSYEFFAQGYQHTTSNARCSLSYAPKRVVPTLLVNNVGNFIVANTTSNYVCTSIVNGGNTKSAIWLICTVSGTPLITGSGCLLLQNSTNVCSLYLSAEL